VASREATIEVRTQLGKGVDLSTAVIGAGNIGRAIARNLVGGGETVVLAAKDATHAGALAEQLGPRARAASVEDAIADANTVVLALWLADMRDVIAVHTRLLEGKVVIDPSNPIGFDTDGQIIPALPDGQTAGSIIHSLLPANAHYVKALGTLSADTLTANANRTPKRAVLFYATDDAEAASTAERLIRTAGYEPVKLGNLNTVARMELPGGDLTEFGLNGEVLDVDQAQAAIHPKEVPA
jgi:predicted dinucleotide-binding enzyme